MQRTPFNFADISKDCQIETGCHQLGKKRFGLKIHIPEELKSQYPYNASAYDFLQFLRPAILQHGTVELPNLAVNPSNYTIKLKSPREHIGNPNPFISDECQSPHQDTPPYPTAFWLSGQRQFYATWVMNEQASERFYQYQQAKPELSIKQLHQILVNESLNQGTGLLLNQEPGLLLIDNSQHHKLYHARTCNFAAIAAQPNFEKDSPMYAFNEIGLLNYIDTLDIHRGEADKNQAEAEQVRAFLQQEPAFN
jgi:hypothetical protein